MCPFLLHVHASPEKQRNETANATAETCKVIISPYANSSPQPSLPQANNCQYESMQINPIKKAGRFITQRFTEQLFGTALMRCDIPPFHFMKSAKHFVKCGGHSTSMGERR